MNRPNESVMAVQALLRHGETASGPLENLSAGLRFGLWFRTTDGKRCVASAVLAHLAASLPNRDEATAALFACEDRYRASWWPLVAARFRDAGRRRHLPELCMGIDQVGPASAAVRTLLPQAALKATGFGELETLLFGARRTKPWCGLSCCVSWEPPLPWSKGARASLWISCRLSIFWILLAAGAGTASCNCRASLTTAWPIFGSY